MELDTLRHQALADIVIADTRTARVFDRLGLDYCCHGQDTLEEAATEHGLGVDAVIRALEAIGPPRREDAIPEWPALNQLTAHIVGTHHAYVREAAPAIRGWIDKIVARHGANHPELAEVRTVFASLAEELSAHMLKEENILFPYIDSLARASGGQRLPAGPFGTVRNPIRMMEHDHEDAGRALVRLRQLTGGYKLPTDACTTYRACYEELERFENDLHRHVHLENNVLFPRAVALEGELTGEGPA